MQRNKIIFYKTLSTDVSIDIIYKDETFWLSQKQLAVHFGVDRTVVTKHIKNILDENELDDSTSAKIALVQKEGNRDVKRNIDYYNLDMIIAVGYRISSKEATQFRIWATNTLKEFIIKGFVMDDDRLKNGQHFGEDYFKELLERIRAIRSSERRINKFLDFNEYKILDNFGVVSHKQALSKANEEYEKFKIIQDREYISDFDKMIKILEPKNE